MYILLNNFCKFKGINTTDILKSPVGNIHI